MVHSRMRFQHDGMKPPLLWCLPRSATCTQNAIVPCLLSTQTPRRKRCADWWPTLYVQRWCESLAWVVGLDRAVGLDRFLPNEIWDVPTHDLFPHIQSVGFLFSLGACSRKNTRRNTVTHTPANHHTNTPKPLKKKALANRSFAKVQKGEKTFEDISASRI